MQVIVHPQRLRIAPVRKNRKQIPPISNQPNNQPMKDQQTLRRIPLLNYNQNTNTCLEDRQNVVCILNGRGYGGRRTTNKPRRFTSMADQIWSQFQMRRDDHHPGMIARIIRVIQQARVVWILLHR